ncbi:MAG: hypothetical protein HIU57_07530 [Acidobacteria bacterium]|nr:hypothetical protein [Acidobacteriota bacterium]
MLSSIRVETLIARPRDEVWEELRHIARHVQWMSDAQRIDFQTDQHEGVGTSFVCLTRLGPFTTRDVMTVTRWDDDAAMGVTHRGIFTGHGEFILDLDADATRVTWREDLRFPWWFAGPLGEFVARPILRRVWRKNLANLAELVTSRER